MKHRNWHHDLAENYYKRALKGEIKKLMIFQPPRTSKTTMMVNAILDAHNINDQLNISSYYQTRAVALQKARIVKNDLSEKGLLTPDDHSLTYFGSGKSTYYSMSVCGPAVPQTDICFIDDTVKNIEESKSEVIQSKLYDWYEVPIQCSLSEDPVIVIICSRWGKKDLPGRILKKEGIMEYNGNPSRHCAFWECMDDKKGEWTVLNLFSEIDESNIAWKHPDDPRGIGDALWPDKFPMSHLQQFKHNKSNWLSLWQGTPSSEYTF
jgi:hypothetical protein